MKGQVLAAGTDRDPQSPREGHLHRLRGRAERLSPSHRSDVQVQTCIVHLVRASLNYVGWKERKQVAADLKTVYQALTAREAEQRLEEFAAKWDNRYAR